MDAHSNSHARRLPQCETPIRAVDVLIEYETSEGQVSMLSVRTVSRSSHQLSRAMSTFDVEPEQITAFKIDDEYLFAHYFTRQDLFEQLSEYYNEEAYRFEIPAADFEAVREQLADEYIEFVVVEELEPYCVVKGKYTEHADILRDSVIHWEHDGQLLFVMKDELSVNEAIERGATPIADTEYVVGL